MTHPKNRHVLTIAELEQVNHVTANNARNLRHQLEKLAEVAVDARAEQRRSEQRCAYCEYLRRGLAGQAFTKWSCRLCQEPQPLHHNTAVPCLCRGCAVAYALCSECGGDLETEHRGRRTGRTPRTLKPTPKGTP